MAFEEREMGGASSLGSGAADAVPSGGAASLAPDTAAATQMPTGAAALAPAPTTPGATDALSGSLQSAMDAARAAIRSAASGLPAMKFGGMGGAAGGSAPNGGGSIAELVKSMMASQTAQPTAAAPAAPAQPQNPASPAQPAPLLRPAPTRAQPAAPAFEAREFGKDDPFGRTGSGMFADVNGTTFDFGGGFDPADTAAAQKAYDDAVAVQGAMDEYYA